MVEWIAGIIVTIFVGLFGWSLRRNVDNHDKQIKKMETDNEKRFCKIENELEKIEQGINAIKGNYLNRFSDAKDHTTNKIAEVIQNINDNKVTNIEEHGKILTAIAELKAIFKNK